MVYRLFLNGSLRRTLNEVIITALAGMLNFCLIYIFRPMRFNSVQASTRK